MNQTIIVYYEYLWTDTGSYVWIGFSSIWKHRSQNYRSMFFGRFSIQMKQKFHPSCRGAPLHSLQIHLPLGASARPPHSKWNHSIEQSGLSQAIIFPNSAPPHVHHASLTAMEDLLPPGFLRAFLVAAALRASAFLRSLTLERCLIHISTSSVPRRVCLASSSVSLGVRWQLRHYWDCSSPWLSVWHPLHHEEQQPTDCLCIEITPCKEGQKAVDTMQIGNRA